MLSNEEGQAEASVDIIKASNVTGRVCGAGGRLIYKSTSPLTGISITTNDCT